MKAKRYIPPTPDEVAAFAYAIYAHENPHRALELWQQARAQLVASRKHDAGIFDESEILHEGLEAA
jgi:hypothetical protein